MKGRWNLAFSDLSFADSTEVYMGEEVSGVWKGTFKQTKSGAWAGTQHLMSNKGAILTPNIYIEPETYPLQFESQFRISKLGDQLTLNNIKFDQHSLLRATGKATINLDQVSLTHLDYSIEKFVLADIFINNLQPILENPLFETLELSGFAAIEGSFDQQGTNVVHAVLSDVNMEQGLSDTEESKSNFAIYGLQSTLSWSDSGIPEESVLMWDSAELFGEIPVGSTRLKLRLKDRDVILTETAHIPLFDGSLVMEKLSSSKGETSAGDQFHFKGYLTPVSMELFSEAMGWPTLSGKVSGMIPGVNYQAGILKIDGIPLVRLFGGSILLRDLQLEDLFGALPALNARVELKDIDLETLTRTFSFGKITGTLEGEVNELRMENWSPVSFDAWFATPENDSTRHRISQKAVDNISNLGGAGVAGALSRSFMRIFKEFSYARLGLKCKLKGNICLMSGIEEAGRGYYLVKGGGLPRIDILGFNRRTDWQQLIDKLERITSGGDVVIE